MKPRIKEPPAVITTNNNIVYDQPDSLPPVKSSSTSSPSIKNKAKKSNVPAAVIAARKMLELELELVVAVVNITTYPEYPAMDVS